MKPEPLKNKAKRGFTYGEDNFDKKDIYSAVDWLKKQIDIWNGDLRIFVIPLLPEAVVKIHQLIDEAFADVVEGGIK